MAKVPYFTTDDETQYCGHIWRQRQGAHPSGRWGFQWEVLPPGGEEPIAGGWRSSQEAAEKAMAEALERAKGVNRG